MRFWLFLPITLVLLSPWGVRILLEEVVVDGGAGIPPHYVDGGAGIPPHNADGGAGIPPHNADGGAGIPPH